MHFSKVRRALMAMCLGATFSATAFAQVTINEVMADNRSIAIADGSAPDWVELYNAGTEPVNLGNWSLTDTAANPRRWVFPNGVTIPGRGYLVIALDSGRPASTAPAPVLNAGFGIKGTGDNVALYTPQTTLVDSVRFGPQVVDFTIGAIPDGSDSFVLTVPTPGAQNVAQPVGSPLSLRINEWMARPSSGEDWFELYNGANLPVQLTGLYFVDSNDEPSFVAPLSFIGTGRDAFLQFIADNSTNDNEVDFALGTNGDTIGLYLANGTRIHAVQFGPQVEDRSQGSLPDGSDNVQTLTLATPGGSNLTLYDGIVVNELLNHTDPPFEDAVEFYNRTASPIDVSGWYLSNSRSDLKKYRLPAGTTIPANGYLVIYENQFNGPAAQTPFTFEGEHDDRVVLSQAQADGSLTGAVVDQEFEAAERNVSWGRVGALSAFAPLQTPTFGVSNPSSLEQFRQGTGATNSAPRIGPVVISEIMYNPGTNTTSADPFDPEEYIKLTNISGSPVPLYDPNHPENTWKLSRGVTFTFPPSTTLPAFGSIVLVSFNPADATQAATFRTKYSVPQSVPLYGPYVGKLDNSGEAVGLYRPDEPEGPNDPDAGFVPYILVDRVDYSDTSPWPSQADGFGQSLHRKILTAFGNDPANWEAAAPGPWETPGGNEPEITSVQLASGTIQITVGATVGQQYTLEGTGNLGAGATWEVVSTSTATGSSVVFSDPATGTQRFYRVRTQ